MISKLKQWVQHLLYFCSLKQSIKISLKQSVFQSCFLQGLGKPQEISSIKLEQRASVQYHPDMSMIIPATPTPSLTQRRNAFFLENFLHNGSWLLNLKEYFITITLSSRKMSLSEISWFADITTLNIRPNRRRQSTLASLLYLC